MISLPATRVAPVVSRRRSGMTIVEIVFAFAIFMVVLATLWAFYIQSRKSETNLSGGLAAQQDLMVAMQTITREVQEGERIFYPAAAAAPESGLGFITNDGCAVMYLMEADPAAATAGTTSSHCLVRLNLVSNERRVIAHNVNYFKVKVEPHVPGKKPCLATLNLSILRGRTNEAGKADDFNLITKVFLRNVNQDLPQPN